MPTSNEILDKFSPAYYDLYRDEMLKRNAAMLHALIWFGIIVSGAGALARALMHNWWLFWPFAVMLSCFILLIPLRHRLVALSGGNYTLVLYVVQAPIWTMAILLGSVLDPTNPTVTFFLFVVMLPQFILDRPRRVIGYTLGWILVFVLVAFLSKPFDVYLKDMSFLVMFALASLVSTALILVERLDALKLFAQSEHHARTDTLTGLKNRYALSKDLGQYLDKDLLVSLTCIDDLAFFVDSFGHDTGDSIMRIWGKAIGEHFGSSLVYRYTANDVLIIVPNGTSSEFEATANNARNEFRDQTALELFVRPECSYGYVFGIPTTEDELRLMISHADVRLSEARRAGKSQIRGAAFDPNRLKLEELAARLGGDLESSSIDALTGLPNMQAFSVRARSLIDTTVDTNHRVVIIYFDLENFKNYNEEFGFQKGDDLLRDIAGILREAFPGRLVARFSDDHFVVMCYHYEYEGSLAQAMNKAYDLHGHTDMPLRAGVYVMKDPSEDVSRACDRARAACRSIMSRYDVFWREYDEELNRVEERRRHIIAYVDTAIEQGWLKVYYQPIVHAKTRIVAECEALVRWIDPVYGFMPPIDFIGELEKAHLIHKVDLWVAEKVCSDYRDRVKAGLKPFPVSINLSRLDFVLCDVESELLRLTSSYGVPRKDLHVEVTESAISEDFTQLVHITNKLRELGFEIWLDDFGSDYSSLTTLKDFPCDVIKLDMMFLRSSDGNERARTIIKQVIELAHRLGARSLVEGVEEQQHLDYLASVGCDLAQGYLVSKPEPLEALVEKGLLE